MKYYIRMGDGALVEAQEAKRIRAEWIPAGRVFFSHRHAKNAWRVSEARSGSMIVEHYARGTAVIYCKAFFVEHPERLAELEEKAEAVVAMHGSANSFADKKYAKAQK